MLRLRPDHLEAMRAHARAEAPREACGILGGRVHGGVSEVVVVHPCRNVAAAPEWEYVVAPEDQLRAFLDIEDARGLEVLGFYHSHPRGPPGPSAADAARATYPGASYVILWLAPRAGEGSWRWNPPHGFEPEGLEGA